MHMKRAIALGTLLLVTAAAPALAAPATQPLPLPKGSTLVGEASVTEIRAFPEERKTKGGTRVVEEAQGVRGVDRLYETPEKYPDAVFYFDKALRRERFLVHDRTVTRTSTVWALTRPDGGIARLAVRNTKPTTFEWIAAVAATKPPSPR
jgi:hypothetical protein